MSGVVTARTERSKFQPRKLAILAGFVAIAAIGGTATARSPRLAFVGAVGFVAVVIAVRHLTGAVALVCASFYFDGYLTGGGSGVTGTKAIGALVVIAWAVNWATDRRPFLTSPVLTVLGAFAVWVLLSAAAARNETAALTTASRYFFLMVLVFLLIQELGQDRSRVDLFVDVLMIAGGIAGAFGTFAFLFGGSERAAGPISDPNDFAIVLAATLPLVVLRLTSATGRRRRIVAATCGVAMVGGVLASFSRGAAVAIAVGLVWSLVTRRIGLRWLVGAVIAVVLVGGLAYAAEPQVIDHALNRKEHVAGSNVAARFTTWDVAIKEFQRWPVFGVGPGNYRERFRDFRIPDDLAFGPYITHNTLLSVLAELGLPGFLLFATFLGLAYVQLRIRTPWDPHLDQLRSAFAGSLLIAIAGALFIDAQFSPSLYIAAGVGAGLVIAERRTPRVVPALA